MDTAKVPGIRTPKRAETFRLRIYNKLPRINPMFFLFLMTFVKYTVYPLKVIPEIVIDCIFFVSEILDELFSGLFLLFYATRT